MKVISLALVMPDERATETFIFKPMLLLAKGESKKNYVKFNKQWTFSEDVYFLYIYQIFK